jgi:hypothetical protein
MQCVLWMFEIYSREQDIHTSYLVNTDTKNQKQAPARLARFLAVVPACPANVSVAMP